jgi:hypothetical protein
MVPCTLAFSPFLYLHGVPWIPSKGEGAAGHIVDAMGGI